MLEAQIVIGAVTTLALAVFLGRRLAARAASVELPPVSTGWLAERRRVRDDLMA